MTLPSPPHACPAFSACDLSALLHRGADGGPKWPLLLAHEVSDLLLACLHDDPSQRPLIETVAKLLAQTQGQLKVRVCLSCVCLCLSVCLSVMYLSVVCM